MSTSLRNVLTSALVVIGAICLVSSSASAAKCKKGHKAKVTKRNGIVQATFKKFKGKKACVTFDGVKSKKRRSACLPKARVECTGSKKPVFKKGEVVRVALKGKKSVKAKIRSAKRGKYCVKYPKKAKRKNNCVIIGRITKPIKAKELATITAPKDKPTRPEKPSARPAKDTSVSNNQASTTTPEPEPSTNESGTNTKDPMTCYKMSTGTQRSDCMVGLMNESLQPKVNAILKELRDAGWKAVVHEARRNKAQQEKKCRDGHSSTMCSHHMCDKGADIIDRRWAWGNSKADKSSNDYKISTGKHPFWTALGIAAKKQGAVWGGDWRRPDVAHIQFGSCTLADVRPYGVTSCDCPK